MNNSKPKLIASGYVFTFALVATLFFMWALPNILNDVLIKQFQKSLELTRFQAGFIQTAIKFGYFCLAIPAGLFMQRFGYKQGILTGLLTFAVGCFLFYPAASSQIYFVFLSAIFVIGGGLSFLELGANSFVTGLGDPATAARRLNFAQSFNPIGSIVAASLGTHFIFSGNEPSLDEIAKMKAQITATGNAYTDFLQTENARVWPTYFAIGLMVLFVAFLIWKAKFPTITSSEASSTGEQKGSYRKLFKFPHWYGAIISQFFYLGAQLGTWSYPDHLRTGKQSDEGKTGWRIVDRQHGDFYGRPIFCNISDEMDSSHAADGLLCADQYRIDSDCYIWVEMGFMDRYSRDIPLVWDLCDDGNYFFYVIDVSYQFCFRH